MTDPAENPELEYELDAAEAERSAKRRYSESEAYQAQLAGRYQQYHEMCYPINGDQWPADRGLRPGKIHITANIIRPAIEVGARIESLLPRISIPAASLDEANRRRAEATEQLMLQWLEISGWDVWLTDLCKNKRLYSKGILKAFWNDRDKRGDALVVDNPANLRIGWGVSDFSQIDWTLYEYAVSPYEAMRRWPDAQFDIPASPNQPIRIVRGGDHADPLGQKTSPTGPNQTFAPNARQLSQYESRQVNVWDYWYKHLDGTVCNAILVEGTVVQGPDKHPEMPDIPYIVVENEHEPGSPEGVSDVDALVDIQVEMNRLLAHSLQHIADDVDPSWYYKGLDGASMPDGIVPKSNEIIDAGTGDILLVPKPSDVTPLQQMFGELWQNYHKISGEPEILFGSLPGADASGRSLTVQVEAAINRLDPRRRRLYRGLRSLLNFWTYMAEKKNPKIDMGVDDQGQPVAPLGVGDIVKGFRRWQIVAPEITPRDSIENAQNAINKVNARVLSRRSAMDDIGVDSPEAEIALIKDEQRDVYLNPESAQGIASIFPMLQQIQQSEQQQQLQQQVNAATPPVPAQGMSALAQSQVAQNNLQQQQFTAQPTLMQDQNTPQPMTQQGTPPPAAGQGPSTTTLIRSGKALNQLAFSSR